MKFDLIFIGAGIGSSTALINILTKLKKKKITIGMIDKNIDNFPGGVGYSRNLSRNGFFNNPCRLSPNKFVSWTLKKRNKINLINYLNIQNSYSYLRWVKENAEVFLKAKKKIDVKEIYYPRVFYNFWLESEVNRVIKKTSKTTKLFFIKSNIKSLRKKAKYLLVNKKNNINLCEYKIKKKYDFKKSEFIKKYKIQTQIKSKYLFISVGLPAPKKIVNDRIFNDKFYIHDLYESGGVNHLLKLIHEKIKSNNNCVVHFLGSKAGLLECLPEILNLTKVNKINLKLISTSNHAKTLNPAIFAHKKKKYKIKYFTKKYIVKINTPELLLKFLKKEFKHSVQKSFTKYDAWSEIMTKNILRRVINKFNSKDLALYNNIFFQKIRSITRFTYPETVRAKELLEKKGIISMNQAEIKVVKYKKNKFIVETADLKKNIKKTKSDILVCVLGPQKINQLKNNYNFFKNLQKLNKDKVDIIGFNVDNFFRLKKNKDIFLPGFHASGYNPNRQTIIKAITNNSIKASNNLIKKLN
jgi:hypothetical protein